MTSLICHLMSHWKFRSVDATENLEGPPETEIFMVSNGGLGVSAAERGCITLGSLPLGSRLILRSRKDWRTAAVIAITVDRITLSVASPTGHTYRMYRPHDARIYFDGSIPLLGEGGWRVGLARYDVRW